MEFSFDGLVLALAIGLPAIVLFIMVFSVFFDQAFLVRTGTVSRGSTGHMLVALTFDDGPSPEWTPRLLDALRDMNVKATFFVLGAHVKSHPEIAERIVREGHEIENHSYDHPLFIFRAAGDLEREIADCAAAVKEVTGASTRYFRPPRGWLTPAQRSQVRGMGYRVVLWSLNSKDWAMFDYKYIVRHVLRRVQPGDIILFHDSGGIFRTEGRRREETLKAIAMLVPELRQRGFSFSTLAELLEEPRAGTH